MKWWCNNRTAGLLLAAWLPLTPAGGARAAELTNAAAVRQLTEAEAAAHPPVHLRGVVTFFDENLYSRFVQDGTAGIYLRDSTNTPPLQPGEVVEVTGRASPGEYAPIVLPETVVVVGTDALPAPRPVSYQQLASGSEDSQFVEIQGIVRGVRFEEAARYFVIELAAGGGRLLAYSRELPAAGEEQLVDAVVRVRGVCSTQFNRQRQLFAIRLLVPRAADLVVEKAADPKPFAAPARGLGTLLQFAPQGTYGRRVKIAGTVVYQQPGKALYVQDDRFGLHIQTRSGLMVRPGDRVEVVGFPAQGQYTPVLEDAVFRRVGTGPPPDPALVTLDEALEGGEDCRLVRLEARLRANTSQSGSQLLMLEVGDFIFRATLEGEAAKTAFANLQTGSIVAVTGLCLVEPGAWQAGENWRASSFQILLRTAADVTVLAAPPWWTQPRLRYMAALLGGVALVAFGWVVLLRRRVREQTDIIRRQLEVEAGLKERYRDLFENANDMVYTHDLTGRLTSLNQAGERLLQRPRAELLRHPFAELVAADHRPGVAAWLSAVAQGAAPPTMEWDVLDAAGRRIKLEVGTRLVAQNGRPAEVEGIARDITERRTLEREVLEISNREQRRIGHDLHDGVCQQLAGIAYRLEALGDRLREQARPEAGETELIGGLVGEAMQQARNVARGLFPVRLEENGLAGALEELAANAESRFRIQCRFFCPAPPAKVDSEAALHLYYIAQEALLNAVRHGHAAAVVIALQCRANLITLSIEDDGCGFLPGDSRPAGMGVRIMRYRAQVIGATLDLRSLPGRGTRLTCELYPAAKELPLRT